MVVILKPPGVVTRAKLTDREFKLSECLVIGRTNEPELAGFASADGNGANFRSLAATFITRQKRDRGRLAYRARIYSKREYFHCGAPGGRSPQPHRGCR